MASQDDEGQKLRPEDVSQAIFAAIASEAKKITRKDSGANMYGEQVRNLAEAYAFLIAPNNSH